jgi:PBP1b-binding outer membrane lipoprotein LpoB
VKRYLLAIALIPFLCGCTGFSIQQYDEVTKSQISITVAHERLVSESLLQSLADCGAPSDVVEGYKEMVAAELDRLERWIAYELSKKVEPTN